MGFDSLADTAADSLGLKRPTIRTLLPRVFEGATRNTLWHVNTLMMLSRRHVSVSLRRLVKGRVPMAELPSQGATVRTSDSRTNGSRIVVLVVFLC